ncbi:MAG: hypothetical protein A2017_13780 [Lentisphaerae bacterium GWF2_44_16]|nr:MAG: hypothetical protein A2017_13780 [Lentisphaerae bacterium GWF2_44_16]
MKSAFKAPEFISEKECDWIIKEARILAENTALNCEGTEEFNECLRQYGCRIEKGEINFPSAVLDSLFQRIEAQAETITEGSFARAADLPAMDFRDDDKFHYGISGQAGLICDVSGKLRPCMTEDLEHFARMADTFPELEWHHPAMIPQDAPVRNRELHAYATIAMNNSSPRLVSAYSKEAIRYFMEISEVCYGTRERARREAPFIHQLWINTPFTIDGAVLEGALEARRVLGRPVKIVNMPVAGATAPVTIAGCLVVGTAEMLMANIITLALDNCLNGYFSAPIAMDVRRGIFTTGPETSLLRFGAANIARRLFRNNRMVFQSFGLGTTAKTPGAQSMMEKSLGGAWALSCGARVMGALSTLAFSDVISPVQLLLDIELSHELERMAKGIRVNEKTLAVELIRRVVPTGSRFMEDEHTLENYADEQWNPMFTDRSSAMTWQQNPKDMLDLATAKAHELWNSAPNKSPLTEAQKNEIRKILSIADKEMA